MTEIFLVVAKDPVELSLLGPGARYFATWSLARDYAEKYYKTYLVTTQIYRLDPYTDPMGNRPYLIWVNGLFFDTETCEEEEKTNPMENNYVDEEVDGVNHIPVIK